MTTASTNILRAAFESPLPTALAASAGGLMTPEQTGSAVLICIAGFSFLLQLWLSIKKAGSYSRQERQAEHKLANAEMVSRRELDTAKKELRQQMNEFRQELKTSLEALTKDFNETTRDMHHAIGALQTLHKQSQPSHLPA